MEGTSHLGYGRYGPPRPWNKGITALLDPNASRLTLPRLSYSPKCRTCGWSGCPSEILGEHKPGASARAVSESARKGCVRCMIMIEYWKKAGESLDWTFDGHHLMAMTRQRGGSCEMQSLYNNPCRRLMPSFDTSSTAAFDWMQTMLKHCSLCHRNCSNSSRENFLPTRLLQLNPSTDLAAPDIVLIETIDLLKSDTEDSQYLTLSHCWGENFSQYTTTSVTLCERKLGIPNSSLPRTFQDAIMFTWRLGFKYLWIDSLCIIQDDANDWLLESAKMHEVYASSYLTLAATGSGNSSGGLYFTAEPPQHFTTVVLEGDEFPVFMANQSYENHISFHDYYRLSAEEHRRRVRTHPLLTRGWIFQERMLSWRVLHFTRTELAWECRESSACECGYTWLRFSGKCWFPASHAGEYIRLGPWHDYVKEYSNLRLTNDGDRLQALAGIARAVHGNNLATTKHGDKLDIKYYAGLWSCDLAQDLLWFRDLELNPQSTRPNRWCAPSWSWASILGAVSYGYVRNHALFKVLSVATDLVGSDSFGPVRGGRVHILGHITEANVHEHSSLDKCTPELSICNGSTIFTFVADIPPAYPTLEHERPLAENDFRLYLLAGAIQGNPYPELACLVLREERNSLTPHGSITRVFQRVGFAKMVKDTDFGSEDFDVTEVLSFFSGAIDLIII
jgi:hypothetical protein